MIITDPIYGDFDITEPVLLELLQDSTVKRAATVMQSATTATINGFSDFSRLEHCIGAMLLVRHLGASIEEQIAALLHDISHTAFSHVVDVVFKKSMSQNYHEEIKETLILSSNIPVILKQHGFSVDEILDDSRFKLLERAAPELCADRLDYSFRNLYYFKDRLDSAIYYYTHLIIFEGKIVFDNAEVAKQFAEDFLDLDKTYWTDPRCQTAYFILADALRIALNSGVLIESDLLKSDSEVWTILSAQHGIIKELLSKLTPALTVAIVSDNPEYSILTKTRFVNPPIYESTGLSTVFELYPDVKEKVTDHKGKFSKPIGIKVISY